VTDQLPATIDELADANSVAGLITTLHDAGIRHPGLELVRHRPDQTLHLFRCSHIAPADIDSWPSLAPGDLTGLTYLAPCCTNATGPELIDSLRTDGPGSDTYHRAVDLLTGATAAAADPEDLDQLRIAISLYAVHTDAEPDKLGHPLRWLSDILHQLLDQADTHTGPHPDRRNVIVLDNPGAFWDEDTPAGIIALSRSRLTCPERLARVAIVDDDIASAHVESGAARLLLAGTTADAAHGAARTLHQLTLNNRDVSCLMAATTIAALNNGVHTPAA
jgi:hypothetical protein